MRVGSLFSGIGGLDLGLERAGMEIAWQVEINPWCRRVLEKHWPDVPKYGDIRQLTGDELERVDLIAGGFPCQPVSVAGRKLVDKDERWLWPEFVRIVRVVRPQYVLVENVPGLLHRGMGSVLGDLAALGYDAEWEVLSACAMGAPHTRERMFVVAYANSLACAPRVAIFGGIEASVSQGGDGARARARWMAAVARADRSIDGISDWMDRLEALGNAVVPAVAEWIGRRILAFHAARADARQLTIF